MTRFLCVVAAGIALGGCALKGDVRRVEDQLAQYREEAARVDSARVVMLARLLDELARLHHQASSILDTLGAQRQSIFSLQGNLRGEITDIQRQLIAIQELTGQSQVRLRELRDQMEIRPTQVATRPAATQPRGEAPAPSPSDEPGPEELFQMGMVQLQRGSPTAARVAFQKLLDDFAQHGRAADALYWIGESFRVDHPDSAVAAFERVVQQFPNSTRAPLALYKIGLDAERRGDLETARLTYLRVMSGYPRSDEAALAEAKLRNRNQ